MSLICISAGHNPRRTGASFEGFKEYPEAHLWATRIAQILSEKVSVDHVPTGGLKSKVEFINAADCKIAVEIHFNAARKNIAKEGDPPIWKSIGRGSETLYYPRSEKGNKAALIMQKHLASVFPPDRGAKEGWYQMNPKRGIADYFLRKTNCTSLIVEPEFIHRKKIIKDNRETGCTAIASALFAILEDF